MTDSLHHSRIADPMDVWRTALSAIESRLKPQNFDLWFRPITCLAIDGNQITLVVPNRFIKDWFENHYLAIVLEETKARTHLDYEVSWQVRESEEWPPEFAGDLEVGEEAL